MALRHVFRHSIAALILAVLTIVRPLSAHAANELRAVRVDAQSDSALITLSLTSKVAQRLFTLPNPDRLVVDLPNTQRARALRLPQGAGVIEQLRLGGRPGGLLRLVVQLHGALRPKFTATSSVGGYQLTIRLGRTALAADAGTAGAASSASAGAQPASGAQPVDAVADTSAGDVRMPHVVTPTHAPSGADRTIVIAVDAGHGGEDPGATGRSGTHEKDVVLAIARALAARIDATPGMRAALTRDGDYFIPLRDRMLRARAAHADMFVSIHADAVVDRDVAGASVYTLSEHGATSEAARWLAERENSADLKGGISLADKNNQLASVLLDLSQTASIGASVEAAENVLGALDGVGAVRRREVQQAGFMVLKSPDIPSMLVETAYISNPAEERKLRAQPEQQRLASAIFSGIEAYFRKYPPEGSLLARGHAPAPQVLARDPQG
jgi:N-acetylmuramoyl-L-alanine amidase